MMPTKTLDRILNSSRRLSSQTLSPSLVRPAVWILYCKGLGLPCVRSSTCFSVPVLKCNGSRAAMGLAGSKIWLEPFPTARLSITRLLARVRREAQRVAHRKESLQPEKTVLFLNAHWERASPAGLKFRPRDSTHTLSEPEHECRAVGSRGREFADLALRPPLSELGLRARPMSASRGGLAPPPRRADWSRGRRGRAGRGRQQAAASARREWEWRGRPPPPPPFSAAFSLSLFPPPSFAPSRIPGSGRALAGLRIAHSGGAAVFVGWGSGLPLAAGIREQPGPGLVCSTFLPCFGPQCI
ncbi:ly6/PLAUR domain-containing protein 6 isoform X2 [Pteropus medius]|uniref:ly6/PLAUR domain-containing protein 6 isoform X2 n=1 Tax=Pteropus vampyrus TaxID=132908 RepID=UPI00196AC74A|nr:ly6/PLAUR domain-containing protein 6 isoform X2 [Pteropus giganteus]